MLSAHFVGVRVVEGGGGSAVELGRGQCQVIAVMPNEAQRRSPVVGTVACASRGYPQQTIPCLTSSHGHHGPSGHFVIIIRSSNGRVRRLRTVTVCIDQHTLVAEDPDRILPRGMLRDGPGAADRDRRAVGAADRAGLSPAAANASELGGLPEGAESSDNELADWPTVSPWHIRGATTLR